jgi:hypothetical protein
MPQYFFHIFNGHPFTDEVGEEHPDDASAWRDAPRLVRDIEEKLEPGGKWTLNVLDGERPVFQIEVKARKLTPAAQPVGAPGANPG